MEQREMKLNKIKFDIWKYEFLISRIMLEYEKSILIGNFDIKKIFKKMKINIKYEFDWFNFYIWI